MPPCTKANCVPSPRCEGPESSEPVFVESGPVCVPSGSPPDKCGKQSPPLSEVDHHSSGLAQHALVLGSGGVVIPDTVVPTEPPRSDPAVQRQHAQGSSEPEPSRLAPRVKAIWKQRFSDKVAERVEASQEKSTRFNEAKWSVLV